MVISGRLIVHAPAAIRVAVLDGKEARALMAFGAGHPTRAELLAMPAVGQCIANTACTISLDTDLQAAAVMCETLCQKRAVLEDGVRAATAALGMEAEEVRQAACWIDALRYVRVRVDIIGYARIRFVGKSQACMG